MAHQEQEQEAEEEEDQGGDVGVPRPRAAGRSADGVPRVFWTYWDQGAGALPPFNRLCVETWAAAHPQWRLEVVGPERLDELLEPADLPANFHSLDLRQHRADCVKLALLLRHGGVYLDSSVLLWGDLLGSLRWQDLEAGRIDFAGFYLGTPAHVENWCMACRRSCGLVGLWHRELLRYWETRTKAGDVRKDAFFEGADLSHIRPCEESYLVQQVQHACYKKLLDLDIDGFCGLTGSIHLCNAESLLFDRYVFRTAHDHQMGAGATMHMMHVLMWEDNETLAEQIRQRQPPLMKFSGHFGLLQNYRRDDFFTWKHTMRRFLSPTFPN